MTIPVKQFINIFSLKIVIISNDKCFSFSVVLSRWSHSTVLLRSLGKTFFAWHFILNENSLFWLTISCQKPFVFYVSVFCSQIFTQKLKLRSKVGLTYAISIVK